MAHKFGGVWFGSWWVGFLRLILFVSGGIVAGRVGGVGVSDGRRHYVRDGFSVFVRFDGHVERGFRDGFVHGQGVNYVEFDSEFCFDECRLRDGRGKFLPGVLWAWGS